MVKDSSAKKIKVLHITKWYPNQDDVQNGVFIQKHIAAVQPYCNVKILAWLPASDQNTITRESHEDNMAITRTWFKPKTSVAEKRHAFVSYIHSHYNNKNLPDLLHLHVFSPDLLIALYWAKRKNIPVVVSEHWSGYARGLFSQLPKWRKWSFRRLAKANRILPVSAFLRDSMLQSGIKGSYTVVPNIVETRGYSVEKSCAFGFVVVADLVDEIKNISGIIAAFEEVAAIHPQASLHIIGGGPDEEDIIKRVNQSAAAAQIKMYGRLANKAVNELLPSFHCLVLNSRVETFGVVVLEAHAAGLPVISTRCGGPEEWLEEADIAISVDDKMALQQAMLEMFSRKNQEYTFTKHKRCTPEQVGLQLHNVYNEVLKEEALKAAKKPR